VIARYVFDVIIKIIILTSKVPEELTLVRSATVEEIIMIADLV
jgi:hypothetical protein